MEDSNELQNKNFGHKVGKSLGNDGETENELFDIKVEIQDSNEEFHDDEKKVDTSGISCNKCKKVFPVDKNSVEDMKNFGVMLVKHFQNECGKNVEKLETSNNHEIFDREELKCTYCPKDFVSKGQLTKHLKTVHQIIRNHKCMKCDKAFLRQKHLKEHILRLHESKRDFLCQECKSTFKTKGDLKMHFNVHLNSRKYKCDLCVKTFRNLSTLKEHTKGVHDNTKDFKCDQCEKSFTFISKLTRHKNTVHTDIKKYNCNSCEKSFKHAVSLNNHIAFTHEKQIHECDLCPGTFQTASSMKAHKINIHVNKRNLKCSQCPKAFNVKRDLQLHENSKHYKCDECNKGFTSKQTLKYHSRMHDKKLNTTV